MPPHIFKELLIDAIESYFGSGVVAIVDDIQDDVLTFKFKSCDLKLKYTIEIKEA